MSNKSKKAALKPSRSPAARPSKAALKPSRSIAGHSLEEADSSLPEFLRHRQWHSLFLLLLAFLLYANTINHDFTQDDAIVIYDNMYTAKGIAGIPGILAYDTFKGFFKTEGKEQLVAGGRYRPFTLVMFALENQLFGTVKKDDLGNPVKDKDSDILYEYPKATGHFINVLLFALTGVLIYHLLRQLLQPALGQDGAVFISLLTATLFALHPIHTEAVANIKGRDEIMSLLGSLAAIWCSLQSIRQRKVLWDISAGICFAIALFSKENAITFLLILPLALRIFLALNWKWIAWRMVPLAAAAVLFLVMRAAAIGMDFPSQPDEMMNNPFLKVVGGAYLPFSMAEKLATNLFTLGKYIYLLFIPHPLTHDYYPRAIEVMSFGDWQVILSMLIHMALAGLVVAAWKKNKVLSFGILYYFITLSIVSNFVFPVGTHMAERFVYMPSLGFCLAVSALVWPRVSGNIKSRIYPFLALFGVVALLFAVKTISRNTAWKDNYTLFTNDLAYAPNSAKLLNSVGGTLSEKAAKDTVEATRKQLLSEAIGHLQKALTIHPAYKNAYLLLGNCYLYQQAYDSAISSYQNALRLDPNYREAMQNMALAYQSGGKYYGEKMGNLDKALQYLRESDKLAPDQFETLRLLGVAHGVLAQKNRDTAANQQAIEYFLKALAIQPNDANTLFDLGTAYFTGNQPAQAEAYFQKAESAEPGIRQRRGSR